MRNAGWFVWISLFLLTLAGCSQQQQQAANQARERAKAGAQQALGNAQKALGNSSITLKVKTAMGASDKLNTSGISVETKDQVVYLRGTVLSEDQKTLAEQIAKDTVGANIQVVDQLQVNASTKNVMKTP